MRLVGSRTTPIGIDVGNRRVKLVQLEQRGSGEFTLHETASFARRMPGGPIDAEEAAHIEVVMRRRGFAGSEVCLLTPHELFSMHTISLPAGEAPVHVMASAEASRLTQRQPGSFELDCQLVYDPSGHSRAVIASLLPHDAAEAIINCFEEVGLDVVGCYAPTSAMLAALQRTLPRNDEVTCLVDIGWRQGRLFAIARDQVVYQRDLSDGGMYAVFEGIRTQLNGRDELAAFALDAASGDEEVSVQVASVIETPLHALAEYLHEEISASLNYLGKKQYHVTDRPVLLVGGGAGLDPLVETLLHLSDTPFKVVRPSALLKSGAELQADKPTFFWALGAAAAGGGV